MGSKKGLKSKKFQDVSQDPMSGKLNRKHNVLACDYVLRLLAVAARHVDNDMTVPSWCRYGGGYGRLGNDRSDSGLRRGGSGGKDSGLGSEGRGGSE